MKNNILIGVAIFITLAVVVVLVLFSFEIFKDDKDMANNTYNGIEIKYNNVSNNEAGNNLSTNQIDTKNARLEDLPQNYTIEQAIKDGCFTVTYYAVYNKEYLDNFIENTKYDAQNRVESTIRIATTTVEGDLILYDLSYDGENYTLKSDYTRDNYMAEENRKVVINDDIPGRFYTIDLRQDGEAITLELLLTAQVSQKEGEKIYEDIYIVAYPSNTTVYQVAPVFRANVLEVYDNSILVEPIENGEVLGDRVIVSSQGKKFEVGDTVRVIFTGMVMESYPAQINEIIVEKFEIYNN